MARVSLESAHLLRLAQLLSRLKETATGEDASRAERAAQWLRDQVALQDCPDQTLRDFVNSMRQEWLEFSTFTAQEEYHFRANQEDLAKLKAEDWAVMRDYLAYSPRQGERLFQVERREWFLKSPQDTLTPARKWHRTHRQPRTLVQFPPKKEDYAPVQMDPETAEIFQELFGGLLPPKPAPPVPKHLPAKTDASGQTSFID